MYAKKTILVLPTIYGKSLIYVILLVVFDYVLDTDVFVIMSIFSNGYSKSFVVMGRLLSPCIDHEGYIALVVTWLIALMVDQNQRFQFKGIAVEFVGEAQSDDVAVMAVTKGNVQLIY